MRVALALLALTVATSTALGATPFGGDDTGFILPAGATTSQRRCAVAFSHAYAKLILCVAHCHAGRASGKLTSDADEESCEETNGAAKGCVDKWFAATAKVVLAEGGCPFCIANDSVNRVLAAVNRDDANNGLVFCDDGGGTATPFGGDDAGFLPAGGNRSALATCELGASKALSKLGVCVSKCHDLRATGRLTSAAAEEACETTNTSRSGCLDKYTAAIAVLLARGGCPSCLNPAATAAAFTSQLDGSNVNIYCVSPSGAFLD